MFIQPLLRVPSTFFKQKFIKKSLLKNSIYNFCTEKPKSLIIKQREFTDYTANKKSLTLQLLGGTFLTAIGIYGIYKYKKLKTDCELLNTQINSNMKIKEASIDPSFVFQPLSYTNFDKADNFDSFYSEKDLYLVMGYERQLNVIADYIRYLQNPEEFTKNGIKAPKGFILVGPPGVGKTFIAEAVAGHSGVPIIMISGAEFQKPYVGQGEETMRQLFKEAKKQAPCVVLIDEIDALGKRISSQNNSNSHYINNMIDQFLKLLSEDHPGVIFIGTTNHIDLIDSALIREGRFDKKIFISLPDSEERKKILEHHATGKKLASNVSFDALATLSSGFSGAKLATWVNEAAMVALREDSIEIDIKHFDSAFEMLEIGIPGKSSSNLEKKYHTALHESGHALVGYILNRKIYKTTIREHGSIEGHTRWIIDDNLQTKEYLLDNICILLAGRAAELILEKPAVGCESDFNHAKSIAVNMNTKEAMGDTILGTQQNVEEILQDQLSRAISIIKEHQQTWEKITYALMENEDLFAEDINAIFINKSYEKEKSFSLKKPSSTSTRTSLNLPPVKKIIETENSSENLNSIQEVKFPQNLKESKAEIPFTKEQVGKALNIDAKEISKIVSNNGEYQIIFKISYNEQDELDKITEMIIRSLKLRKIYDIRNYYDSDKNRLTVMQDSVEKFNSFVKEYNEDQ